LKNITVLLCFDQINAALGFSQKHFRKPTNFWAALYFLKCCPDLHGFGL